MSDSSSLPFVEKYRPTSMDQLIGHQNITETSKKFSKTNLNHNFPFKLIFSK